MEPGTRQFNAASNPIPVGFAARIAGIDLVRLNQLAWDVVVSQPDVIQRIPQHVRDMCRAYRQVAYLRLGGFAAMTDEIMHGFGNRHRQGMGVMI
jgi:hypothetical protein